MTGNTEIQLSRRNLFKVGAIGAGAVVLGKLPAGFGLPASRAAEKNAADPYGGFKMGIQSYSLRGYDAETALKHTKTLGLKYWESFPAHIPMGTLPALLKKNKALLDDANVELMAYGVVSFGSDETKSRAVFDFAKAMGISSISANPEKDKPTFDLLDKLVEEYDIAIAIHNHGPGADYDKISDVETMVKDRNPKVGACVDTGHYLRSDEDPVDAIHRLGKRVYGVHLKDVKTLTKNGKRQKVFTILGQGDLKVLDCLKALRELKYENCLALEYEENPENPLSDIEICLKEVRNAVAQLG